MDETEYIEQVRLLYNSPDSNVDKVRKIYALPLPDNASPLVVLINGDSRQLSDAVTYAKNYDPVAPSDEEINKLQNRLADKIIEKIRQYLADWDAKNFYSYHFRLKATYGAFTNDLGEVEYIDIIKNANTYKTIPDVIQAAKQWQTQLLRRVTLYTEQDIGHKQISVKPMYTIRDASRSVIASGTLEFDDERGVSTRLNQI